MQREAHLLHFHLAASGNPLMKSNYDVKSSSPVIN